uniref:DUF659 domain-containing protein n=1 Tax=Syphacia muris TaxID=451379 RepID=A0A0N5AUR5_9BILA
MKTRAPKPYLKCSLRFDWHIPTDDTSIEVVDAILKMLVNHGFRRQPRKAVNSLSKKLEKSGEGLNNISDAAEGSCHSVIADGNNQGGSEIVKSAEYIFVFYLCFMQIFQAKVATIGFRSVLRAMNRDLFQNIFLDANVINPSAVKTTLGLYALKYATSLIYYIYHCPKTKVYVLKHLSERLSKGLNMPSVTAIGINNEDKELCAVIDKLLIPVEQKIREKKSKNTTLESVASITPVGKLKNRKRKKPTAAKKKL